MSVCSGTLVHNQGSPTGGLPKNRCAVVSTVQESHDTVICIQYSEDRIVKFGTVLVLGNSTHHDSSPKERAIQYSNTCLGKQAVGFPNVKQVRACNDE